MPSWQQISAKKGSERYLMFTPNHKLITLRWGDGRSPGHENVCRWFLLKQIQIITGSVKTKKSCVSWKMFKMEFKFSELFKIIVSEPTKRLAAQSTAYALRKWQCKQTFVKENE